MSAVLAFPARRWPVAATTTVVWVLAAASVVFWGLRLAAPADQPAPPAVSGPGLSVDPAAVAALLGVVHTQQAVAAPPDAATRFSLLGVVAGTSQGSRGGAALIAVDGKPPRPFRVGAKVADGFVLQSLGPRSVSFGGSVDGPSLFTLQLPARPMAVNAPRTPPAPAAAVASPAPVQPQAPAQPAAVVQGANPAVQGGPVYGPAPGDKTPD